MKVVAFVPAKGESERLPNKNLTILDGEFLFRRKLRQLIGCRTIDAVYLDTESEDIASKVGDLPVQRLHRPKKLATNKTDGHELFAFETSQVPDADIFVQAICTAPFVDSELIDRAVSMLISNPAADGVVAVRREKHYEWVQGEPVYGRGRIPNSVDLPEKILEGMSLYVMRRRPGEGPPQKRFGEKTLFLDLAPIEQIDINNPIDLLLAEHVCAGQRAKVVADLRLLRPYLSTSILADIAKDEKLATVLPVEIKLIGNGRILGLAKTLKLMALLPSAIDSTPPGWRGIYDALSSYEFVRPGDVIVVATDVPERAYFGDLNANLAIRAGAVGAIIDGATRDADRLAALDFPVGARSTYCNDIRYEGTVEAINAPVRIGGVNVRNDDVVFADSDGVVIIPSEKWAFFKKCALGSMQREMRVRIATLEGDDPSTILSQIGEF